jgi:hypothetical protein
MNNKSDCINAQQFEIIANEGDISSLDLASMNEHLANCASCRQKLRDSFSSNMRSLETMFEQVSLENDCLDADLIIRYVTGQSDAIENEIVEMHIEDCAECSSDIESLQSFMKEIESSDIEAAMEYDTENTDVMQSKMKLLQPSIPLNNSLSWLKNLCNQMTNSLRPMPIFAASYSFSTKEETSVRHSLEFADVNASGSLFIEDNKYWLHVEHTLWNPGTLVMIELNDSDNHIIWRRFALLRKGFRRAVAELVIENASFEGSFLSMGVIEACDLPSIASNLLWMSFEESNLHAHSYIENWHAWAMMAQDESLDDEIAKVVVDIIRSSQI